jgi:hypothetical protein
VGLNVPAPFLVAIVARCRRIRPVLVEVEHILCVNRVGFT